ncbi:retrovirus-related pol polyprotein from transposon TNT 1-94 [Tanacetum coccineum]
MPATSFIAQKRVRQLNSSPGVSSTPTYSPGPSTPPSYSQGPATPQSYSSGPSKNEECSNCKHLLGKIKVLEATLEMRELKLKFKLVLTYFEASAFLMVQDFRIDLMSLGPEASNIHGLSTLSLDTMLSSVEDLTKTNSFCSKLEDPSESLRALREVMRTPVVLTAKKLLTSSNTRNQATVQDDRVVVQNVHGRLEKRSGEQCKGAGATGNRGVQNRVGNANPGGQDNPVNDDVDELPVQDFALNVDNIFQADECDIKCYNCNRIGHIARNYTQPKRPQNSEYFKDKMLLMQAQENGMVLDEEQLMFLTGDQDNAVDDNVDEPPVQDLALNVENIFQANECDAFDSDVDEDPTA